MKILNSLSQSYLKVRSKLLEAQEIFKITKTGSIEILETEILDEISLIENSLPEGVQKIYYRELQGLAKALSHLLKWGYKEVTAGLESERELRAAVNNAKIACQNLKPLREDNQFTKKLLEFSDLIKYVQSIDEIEDILITFARLPMPIPLRGVDSDSPLTSVRSTSLEPEQQKIPLVVTAKLYIDNAPWANPQLLSPQTVYRINAVITLNFWPEKMGRLSLKPVSTSEREFYSFSLGYILKDEEKNKYEVSGQLAFNYAQASFEDIMTIKLFAVFENDRDEEIIPTLIGFTELRAKVLKNVLGNISTGYSNIDLRVFEILKDIEKDFPKISPKEKESFAKLLAGIANYQGVCLQEGIFRKVSKLKESKFRDELIRHLRARPELGEEIEKEGEVGGGRVEISFRGSIAELKVSSDSNRNEVMEKYRNQAAAYVAAKSRHLGILCILDLSEKPKPVSSADESIFVNDPVLSGDTPELSKPKTRIITLFVEGNLPTPSSYST